MIKRLCFIVIFCTVLSCDSSSITFFRENNTQPSPGSVDILVVNLEFSGINISHDFRDSANASISPNGEMVVYQSGQPQSFDIYIMNINGSDQRNITNNPENNNFPVFTPDGNSIVFYRNTNVFIMDLDGQNLREIASSPVDIDFPIRFSLDGTKLFVSADGGLMRGKIIVSIPIDGVNSGIVLTSGIQAMDVNIHPILDRLVFIGGIENNLDIFTMDYSGGNKRNLSGDPGVYRDPVYSPDGSLIAYSKQDPSTGFNNIFIMTANGTETQLTIVAADDLIPVFTPDGEWIAFNRIFDGSSDIYFIDLDRKFEVNYTNTTSGFDLLPIFSSANSVMIFQSDLDRDFDIYLAILDNLPPLLKANDNQ